MGLALEQAKKAESCGEVPVGAVFIDDDQVIAEAGNASIILSDPTAHAEIVTLREAAEKKGNYRLGGTLFVTLEPCIMCMGALIHARVKKLIFGAYDPRSGAALSVYNFSDSPHLNHRIEVEGGILERESQLLLKDFFIARR
ncbi:MAG TPA: nucleoside deaminase [Gammaproteobacteria bacterium]|nr:nucleoside deaminase [Gammaproteobacteria bacterium]